MAVASPNATSLDRPPGVVSQAPPPLTTPPTAATPAPPSRTEVLRRELFSQTRDEYSFSQTHGYEEVPRPLKLTELPEEARTRIWNLFFVHLDQSMSTSNMGGGPWVGRAWKYILRTMHVRFDNLALDDWRSDFWPVCKKLRKRVETAPFNEVFDLIQFVLRHPHCPRQFVTEMKHTFADCRLAYVIDVGPPVTILPAATPEEGGAVVESLQTLRQAGLDASAAHLREAAACINADDWPGSMRESIHAVESVARQLDPEASRTLGPALTSLERRRVLHPALKEAFGKLYGYTSDEQGIRHARLDRTDTAVGQDEAVFMLGACASFAGYLWRRHVAGEPS